MRIKTFFHMTDKSYNYNYQTMESFLQLTPPEEVAETLDEAMNSTICWAGETERPASSLPEDYRIMRTLRNIFRNLKRK